MRVVSKLALTTVVISASVTAQAPERYAPIGSRLERKTEKRAEEQSDVRKIQARFGDCVVKKQRSAAVTYLLEHPSVKKGDREGERIISKLADGVCLIAATAGGPEGVQMELRGDMMRYVLSDSLVREELGQSALGDLANVVALSHPVLDETDFQPKPGRKPNSDALKLLSEARAIEQVRIYLSHFGECVVRANPMGTRALLAADVVTPAENAAFASLSGDFGECIPKGQSLTLNKALVRGTVAYNYYRLAKAPRIAPAAGAPK